MVLLTPERAIGEPLDGPVVPVDISLGSAIRRLEADLGLDDYALSQALRVDRRTLTRWVSGETYPRQEGRDRLHALATLHARLGLTWKTAGAARRWLHRPSPYLGHAEPADMIRAGRFDRVEAALEAIDSGFAS
jgi:transcriptional regulator with XRE-family HTH domain